MTVTGFNKKIQLCNSGELQVFFVGTGSAFNKVDFQNNILIIKGSHHFLIDCGTLFSFALKKYNTSLSEIKTILPTHSHADHIGGLEEVAFMNKYVSRTKPNMIITDEFKKILWNNSLKGGCAFGEEEGCGKVLGFDDFFNQLKPVSLKHTPRPMFQIFVGSIKVTLFRTVHIPFNKNWKKMFYSVGVLVDDKVLITGDTRFDPEIIDYFEKNYSLECIFHDCQFFKGGIHASYQELLSLPDCVREKTYLCHYGENKTGYYPEQDGFAGFVQSGVYYTF